ncbi:putative stage IV sporulation protein [Paenibacillus larvae subsp. larvae]|uniref:Putative stage IV sporulation protein n=1 Tax=Paenibacillus larvae subsp. larvae TaxID=147375 RepID=A0A2L1UGI3_9BACL|nr:sporulation protein YqfD [Paenibacillus larvae]AQT83908.1 sporulation protein YqfD [Paenibacillus larvae subsp. pulvifaciens]AQZ45352.1 sporulation protein YqfD [Paenibacillus larvae subsp. pulvifaciens]AVF27305.1 putative stage IV sporulation protein [Paenibacillus larvae subsp. larvae]AVF31968.1 putative stage IV sporulation protein [Paenibacillus larvae subsp. larvae]MBH0343426.1 sporulation protein [Paenibacillus larvae]
MQAKMISWLQGYVSIEIRGKRIEAFLNEAMAAKMSIWDIQFNGEHILTLFILVRDFFRLRPLLKRTGCKLHVKERFGLPFATRVMLQRKWFAVGLLSFIAGLYLLSSLVWSVTVEGNEKIPKEQILSAAAKQGVHRFQWKFKLGDSNELASKLQSSLPGVSWIGVELHGTRLTIKVVEAKLPEKKKDQTPKHIIAGKNAVITEILAKKGKPQVRPGSYVKKGSILISGLIGDEANQAQVTAEGTVKGLVWYESDIESPLTRTYQIYTGESKDKDYLVIGNRGLQLTGYGKNPFKQSETVPRFSVLTIKNWKLPFGWLNEKVMETKLVEEPVKLEDAKKTGLEQARTKLLTEAGKDARIVSEKILHEKTESGKVYMKVHFEVEQYMMEEQPIG